MPDAVFPALMDVALLLLVDPVEIGVDTKLVRWPQGYMNVQTQG
jgi:hypothetical protein